MLAFLALASCTLAKAGDSVLFSDDFSGSDAGKWTLQQPLNALGPISANGAWKAQSGALVATGSGAPWTIQTAGDSDWKDYKLSARMTIVQPAPKSNFKVYSGEFDRYLSRDLYPPLVQHTGQYRYRYYAGEFDWGSDAAILFRYKDRENCYRLQFSVEYQEIILWHGTGGYLQIVPCKLIAGREYNVEIQVSGSHLQAWLDGGKVIDYWHECLPTLAGRVGLAAYCSTVAFRDVKVTGLPTAVEKAPPHQACFAVRSWRGLQWIFDGNEPIVLMEPQMADGGSPQTGEAGAMMYHFVKLRPGYRPLFFDMLGIMKNNSVSTLLVGAVTDIKTTGEGTSRLVIPFDTQTADKSVNARYVDVLTYDTSRSAYRHDVTVNLTFNGSQRIQALQFGDPLTYNNLEPGPGVKYRWPIAGHKWGIFTGADGHLYRHPISDSLNMTGQNGWDAAKEHALWMLYPDKGICPVWENDVSGRGTWFEVCHWGHDFHQSIPFAGGTGDMAAGAGISFHYAMTGYPEGEAKKLFDESKLAPLTENPPADPRVPNPLEFAVCDPSGTSFDKLHSTRDPYVGWQFYGTSYQVDKTFGRTDHYSLRLDGPASVTGMIYLHMLDGYAKRYLCTFWVNGRGMTGSATAVLKYPYGDNAPKDIINIGMLHDNDGWKEFSFITTVPSVTRQTYDASEFNIELNGKGALWLDDFSIRPIEENETVTEHRPSA